MIFFLSQCRRSFPTLLVSLILTKKATNKLIFIISQNKDLQIFTKKVPKDWVAFPHVFESGNAQFHFLIQRLTTNRNQRNHKSQNFTQHNNNPKYSLIRKRPRTGPKTDTIEKTGIFGFAIVFIGEEWFL